LLQVTNPKLHESDHYILSYGLAQTLTFYIKKLELEPVHNSRYNDLIHVIFESIASGDKEVP
jgi:hypothetical protein